MAVPCHTGRGLWRGFMKYAAVTVGARFTPLSSGSKERRALLNLLHAFLDRESGHDADGVPLIQP
jgi:hypothetical protein